MRRFIPKRSIRSDILPSLDDTERRLLKVLQQDGRISVQDLAQRLNLSTSPVWRRLKRLEDAGIIQRYAALLDRKRLGLTTMAYVHVSLLDHTEETVGKFDVFVQDNENIIECASVTGSDDYLLKVVAEDPEDLERIIMRRVLATGLVRSSTTHFVLSHKKDHAALPLGV
ncbi:MAG: Lrp/AsnC family transcriptional regulator [Pseudomonadota bacterium]